MYAREYPADNTNTRYQLYSYPWIHLVTVVKWGIFDLLNCLLIVYWLFTVWSGLVWSSSGITSSDDLGTFEICPYCTNLFLRKIIRSTDKKFKIYLLRNNLVDTDTIDLNNISLYYLELIGIGIGIGSGSGRNQVGIGIFTHIGTTTLRRIHWDTKGMERNENLGYFRA